MKTLLEFFANVLSTILPTVFKKREPSEAKKEYDQFRFDVAEALATYVCYYGNPIDLAKQPDHKLPPAYENASTELGKLGYRASAIAATSDPKKKKPIVKSEMIAVSEALIRLANSMTTPYNCGVSPVHSELIHKEEAIIRKYLQIEQNNI